MLLKAGSVIKLCQSWTWHFPQPDPAPWSSYFPALSLMQCEFTFIASPVVMERQLKFLWSDCVCETQTTAEQEFGKNWIG